MKRALKQLELGIPQGHGGRRPGAGRPNRSGLQAHVRRPRLSGREPVHVTLKLCPGLPSLRRKDAFRCLRAAVRQARSQGFGIVHFAILSNHAHLILEPSAAGLRKPMQSFGISFAKRLNVLWRRQGAVYRERYHLRVLKTPTEVKRALAYVLSNEAKHRAGKDKRRPARWVLKLDPFSSALVFREWKALFGTSVDFRITGSDEELIEAWLTEILRPARTWLLKQGWRRAP